MEENKKVKISVLTLLLILLLIIMSILIYQLYIEKTEETQKSIDLQMQLNDLSKNLNSNDSIENDDNIVFTDEQVRTALFNYLELKSHRNCNALLKNLTEKGDLNYDQSKHIYLDDGRYITNIKYSDYRDVMLKYVSETEFDRNWNSYYLEDEEGNLLSWDGGGALIEYTIKSITKINSSTYYAETSFIVDDGDEFFGEKDFTFIVIDNNGNCVIDYLTENSNDISQNKNTENENNFEELMRKIYPPNEHKQDSTTYYCSISKQEYIKVTDSDCEGIRVYCNFDNQLVIQIDYSEGRGLKDVIGEVSGVNGEIVDVEFVTWEAEVTPMAVIILTRNGNVYYLKDFSSDLEAQKIDELSEIIRIDEVDIYIEGGYHTEKRVVGIDKDGNYVNLFKYIY